MMKMIERKNQEMKGKVLNSRERMAAGLRAKLLKEQ